MFGVNDLDGDEVVVDVSVGKKEDQSEKVAKKEVSTVDPVTTTGEVVTTTDVESKCFEEVQQAFNKTMDWINNFVAMDSDAVKDRAVEISKRPREKLEFDKSKKQKLDENVQVEVVDNDTAELKRCLEIVPKDDDDVTIKATPLIF
nr:hypothetical protein [Tanacetum cinerariifolium]